MGLVIYKTLLRTLRYQTINILFPVRQSWRWRKSAAQRAMTLMTWTLTMFPDCDSSMTTSRQKGQFTDSKLDFQLRQDGGRTLYSVQVNRKILNLIEFKN